MIHIHMIHLTARDCLDTLCPTIGWHIAIYRSIVNPVIVRTDAYDVDSRRNALKIQNGSPNLHG
jgi:hypothetical protein